MIVSLRHHACRLKRHLHFSSPLIEGITPIMRRNQKSWLPSWAPWLTKNTLAFGAARFSSSILRTVFTMYVTPVFISIYQINGAHFYVCHVIYAVWNTINDPALAWLQDNTEAQGAARRVPAIKYGGPLWSLAFLIPWWPWTSSGSSWLVSLHFFVSICMFDGFFTYVGLVQSALLADITTDNTLRNNYNRVGSLLGMAGGAIAGTSYYLYNGSDMGPFRLFCIGAACLSCLGFLWAGAKLDLDRLEGANKQDGSSGEMFTVPEMTPAPTPSPRSTSNGAASHEDEADYESPPLRSQRLRSFRFAESIGADEEGTLTIGSEQVDGYGKGDATKQGLSIAPAWSTSFPGWGKAREKHKELGSGESSGKLSFWNFAMQLATHKNFRLYVMMNSVEGFNALIDQSFFAFLDATLFVHALPLPTRAALVSLCLYLPKVMIQVLTPVANRFGAYHVILWAATFKLLAGSVILMGGMRAWPLWAALYVGNRLAGTVWGLYNLCMADVIDEDILRNRRPKSMSVSIHGLQSLFTRPAQRLAPMILMALFPRGAFRDDLDHLTDGELLIWRGYRLHGATLKMNKEKLREWEAFARHGYLAPVEFASASKLRVV